MQCIFMFNAMFKSCKYCNFLFQELISAAGEHSGRVSCVSDLQLHSPYFDSELSLQAV